MRVELENNKVLTADDTAQHHAMHSCMLADEEKGLHGVFTRLCRNRYLACWP
jgi:hypothetical protein